MKAFLLGGTVLGFLLALGSVMGFTNGNLVWATTLFLGGWGMALLSLATAALVDILSELKLLRSERKGD